MFVGEISFDNPVILTGFFVAMALLPFAMLALTSFIKLSVVFGLLRNAIGAQQVPSAAITTLLAFALTLHIMSPVAGDAVSAVKELVITEDIQNKDKINISTILLGIEKAIVPFEDFLRLHSGTDERVFFASKTKVETEIICKEKECAPKGENIFSLVPAFVVSELREAFAIGFVVFLPFLVVDLVVANLLVGMGMMMVSPISIALPFKIILFVLCDGWFLLSRGLVLGYMS